VFTGSVKGLVWPVDWPNRVYLTLSPRLVRARVVCCNHQCPNRSHQGSQHTTSMSSRIVCLLRKARGCCGPIRSTPDSIPKYISTYIIIMSPKLGDILCLLRFLLLLLFFFFFFLFFFRSKFVRHISRRLLNGNQWNFTGMLRTMSRCAEYFRNFQNGRRCHGNGQNAKKIEKHKNYHSRLLAKQKFMKLVRNNIHI
jgi:hypothetical protein